MKNMKSFKDGMGVVFDIRAQNFESFMDNYARLRETSEQINFHVAKCTDLPDLEEDTGGYGGARGGGYQGRGGD